MIKVQQKEKEKENVFIMSVALMDNGDIYVWDILRRVKETFQLADPVLFFYYDYLQD